MTRVPKRRTDYWVEGNVDKVHDFMNAHTAYLQAAFDQIAQDHGDINEFLRAELGIDEAMRAKVRAALLSGV